MSRHRNASRLRGDANVWPEDIPTRTPPVTRQEYETAVLGYRSCIEELGYEFGDWEYDPVLHSV